MNIKDHAMSGKNEPIREYIMTELPVDSRPSCSKSARKPRKSKSRPSHRKTLPPQLKQAIWEKYIGPTIHGYCFVCERAEISFGTNVEYGHVLAVANGGNDSVENLRPVCSSCNKSMGTRNMMEYKASLAQSGLGSTFLEEASSNGITIGAILITALEPAVQRSPIGLEGSSEIILTTQERDQLDYLQFLTDSQINVLAYALGISARNTAARLAIAMKRYKLPRNVRTSACVGPNYNDIREVIVQMDAHLLAQIFGFDKPIGTISPSLADLRIYAFRQIGMTSRPK